MAFQRVGTDNLGYAIYKDTSDGTCYYYDIFTHAFTLAGQCPTGNVATGSPANQTGNNYPTVSGAGVSTGGVLIQHGNTWYEDLLNTLLGLGAIGQGASHIPSTAHVVQQSNLDQVIAGINAQNMANTQNQNANAGAQVGANLGGSLQDFISKNMTLILIGGAAIVLLKSGRK